MGRHKLDPESTTERKCIRCHQVKPLSEFYSHKGATLGKDYLCKPCNKFIRTFKSFKARGLEKLREEVSRDQELVFLKQQAIFELEEDNEHRL